MSKEDFKKNLIEEQLFQELKECPFRNSEYIKKKYQGLDIDHYRLYRRIVNYQIKVYGCQLFEFEAAKDKKRLQMNAQKRHQYKLNRDELLRKKRELYK